MRSQIILERNCYHFYKKYSLVKEDIVGGKLSRNSNVSFVPPCFSRAFPLLWS